MTKSNGFIHTDLGKPVTAEPQGYMGTSAPDKITGILEAYASDDTGTQAKISGEWYLLKKGSSIEVYSK